MEESNLSIWIKTKADFKNWRDIAKQIDEYIFFNNSNSMIYWDILSAYYFLEQKIDQNLNKKNIDNDNLLIIESIDKLINITKGKLLKTVMSKPETLYKVEIFPYGKELLLKYKVNLEKQDYREFKLKKILDNHYQVSSQGNFHKKVDDAINSFQILKLSANFWEKHTTKIAENVLFFCIAIKMGIEPSKDIILKAMENLWSDMGWFEKYKIDMFSEYFIETNVFYNTIAPQKDIDTAIINFFKNTINLNLKNNNKISQEEKAERIKRLLSYPDFKYENMIIKLQKKQALKFFGKELINEQNKLELEKLINKEKTVIKKTVKI